MKTSILLILVILASMVALPVAAATLTLGPCSPGPSFTLGTSANVVVTFRETRPAAMIFGATSFVVAGNNITVNRRIDGSGGSDACASDSVDLASLPAGTYELTWNDAMPGGTRTATYRFFVGLPVSFDDYRQPNVIAPVAPLITGAPVRLLVNWCTTGQAVVGAPMADVTGGTIQVTQGITAGSGSSEACALYLLDLGNLPPRRYEVSFKRKIVTQSGTFDESAAVAFLVQQPAPTASCGGVPIAVNATLDGTARLHYEDVVRGYDPSFVRPSAVNVLNGMIMIEQPMIDRYDYTRAGAPDTHKICHAEELDLGALPAGTYSIDWSYLATLGGSGPYRLVSGNQFVWSGSEMVCAATGRFATDPAVPVAGSPVGISLTRLLKPRFIGPPSVSVNGNEITVTNFINTEGPPQFQPPLSTCQTSSVSLGLLPAGTYRVYWRLIDFGPTLDEGTFTFVVGPSSRRRAAR